MSDDSNDALMDPTPTPTMDEAEQVWRSRLDPLRFPEPLGWCFYEVGPTRMPHAGEFYLGALSHAPTEWCAIMATGTERGAYVVIIRPLCRAVRAARWVKGMPIRLRDITDVATAQRGGRDP